MERGPADRQVAVLRRHALLHGHAPRLWQVPACLLIQSPKNETGELGGSGARTLVGRNAMSDMTCDCLQQDSIQGGATAAVICSWTTSSKRVVGCVC